MTTKDSWRVMMKFMKYLKDVTRKNEIIDPPTVKVKLSKKILLIPPSSSVGCDSGSVTLVTNLKCGDTKT